MRVRVRQEDNRSPFMSTPSLIEIFQLNLHHTSKLDRKGTKVILRY